MPQQPHPEDSRCRRPTIDLTGGGLLDMLSGTSHVHVSSTSSGTPNGTLSVDGTSSVLTEGTLDTGTFTNNGQIQADATSTINATTFTLAGSSSQLATLSAAGSSVTINATTFELNNYNAQINLSTANSSVSLQGSPDYSSGNIGATVNIGDTSTLTLGVGAWEFGYYTQSGAIVAARGVVNLEGGPTLAGCPGFGLRGLFQRCERLGIWESSGRRVRRRRGGICCLEFLPISQRPLFPRHVQPTRRSPSTVRDRLR